MFNVNISIMTIKIDAEQFLFDSLDRILKQVHLNDNYNVGMFSPSEIPAAVKKLGKGIVPPDFFNGVKAKIIVLKAKDVKEMKDEDAIKVAGFIKTTFFLSEDSAFSTNDVYQVKDKEEDSSAGYFFVKMELVK